MSVKITAHIPTQSFGYIELGGLPDDSAEVERLYNKYAEKPIKLPGGNRVKLKAFVGGEVFYNELLHQYSNEAGEIYLSGSVYAESFKKPFDKQKIAEATAKRDQTSVESILEKWELTGRASRELGTAFHTALELYTKSGLIHENPTLKNSVQSFVEAHKNEHALSEVLVVSHKLKRAGRIDRLVLSKTLHCVIDDYKFGSTVKDLEYYWKQLQFYGSIMEDNGLVVDGLRVHHYDGQKWSTYEH